MAHDHFGYPQTSNISCTPIGNKIVDHSDAVGASPVQLWGCSNYIFTLNLTPGFSGLGKDNYKLNNKHLSFEIWYTSY